MKKTTIEEIVRVEMPTAFGIFVLVGFRVKNTLEEHVALIKGKWWKDDPVLVRLHSSCFTGDVLASLRCDCGEQLHAAMRLIERTGKGVILYLNQEGRGIGLMNKLKAYQLQENGLDTVEANLHLGLPIDVRDYKTGTEILRFLGITKIRLLTNNPRKRDGLIRHGLDVVETVPLEIKSNPYNEKYLLTKRDKMGHKIMAKTRLRKSVL